VLDGAAVGTILNDDGPARSGTARGALAGALPGAAGGEGGDGGAGFAGRDTAAWRQACALAAHQAAQEHGAADPAAQRGKFRAAFDQVFAGGTWNG